MAGTEDTASTKKAAVEALLRRWQDPSLWSSYDDGGLLPTGQTLDQLTYKAFGHVLHYGPDGEFRCPHDREA